MADTTATSVGFVLAGLALAASLLGWPGGEVAAGLAAVALVAFALRRYGRLDRRIGSTVAAVAALGAAGVALRAAFLAGGPPGAIVASLAAPVAAVFGYADGRGVDRRGLTARGLATARGVAIGALGIVGIYAWGLLAFLLLPVRPGPAGGTVLSTLASGAGTLTVVALYLHYSRRDRSFLDLRRPGLRGLAFAVGGTLTVLGGNLAIGFAFQRFGVDAASHTVVQTAEADPTVLLVLVPLSFLVIAPGEELLYRNVVQKSLREQFSPVAGVVVASAVFAAVHLPAYSSPDATLQATLSTLAIIFVLALVLGTVYELTRNVVVPILVHGTFNAVAFAVTYAQFTRLFAG